MFLRKNDMSSISVAKHKEKRPSSDGLFSFVGELATSNIANGKNWLRILCAERVELARKRQACESSPKANIPISAQHQGAVFLSFDSGTVDLYCFFLQSVV